MSMAFILPPAVCGDRRGAAGSDCGAGRRAGGWTLSPHTAATSSGYQRRLPTPARPLRGHHRECTPGGRPKRYHVRCAAASPTGASAGNAVWVTASGGPRPRSPPTGPPRAPPSRVQYGDLAARAQHAHAVDPPGADILAAHQHQRRRRPPRPAATPALDPADPPRDHGSRAGRAALTDGSAAAAAVPRRPPQCRPAHAPPPNPPLHPRRQRQLAILGAPTGAASRQ